MVGDGQPAVVHAIAHLINAVLGNVGQTLTFIEPAIHQAGTREPRPRRARRGPRREDRRDAFDPRWQSGVHRASRSRSRAPTRLAKESVYLGLYENETARHSTWFVPQAHYLEAWGDARAYDGTVVNRAAADRAALSRGAPIDEVLAVVAGDRALRRATISCAIAGARNRSGDFEAFWESALHAGVIEGTARAPIAVMVDWDVVCARAAAMTPAAAGIEISFPAGPRACGTDASPTTRGSSSFPIPITKLTWENALLVSPATAAKLGISTEDVVELKLRGRSVVAPVFVAPGQADDTVSLSLGFGRGGAEALASDLGVNAYVLRSDASAALRRWSGDRTTCGQAPPRHHASSTGRWRDATSSDARRSTNTGRTQVRKAPPRADGVALQAAARRRGSSGGCRSISTPAPAAARASSPARPRTTSPIVGPEQRAEAAARCTGCASIATSTARAEDPRCRAQPMLCQHCEKAPCEYVCPVNATVHSPDGLNEMVYNRCVGTRFCSQQLPVQGPALQLVRLP